MDRIRCQVLRALFQEETSIYRLIDRQDASLKEFIDLLDQLIAEDLIYTHKGQAGLTAAGLQYCRKHGLTLDLELQCSRCQGTGLELSPFFADILERFKDIIVDRPGAKKEFDQGFMSAQGVLQRLAFVFERGDIHGNIFVVGDDDFFSIAAALTKLPSKIVAVDVDPQVVDLINQTARDLDLSLEGRLYDVQQDLPRELQNSFHMFLTDPVETLSGLELFLSRGVSALQGPGSTGYFGLSTLEASRNKWLNLQGKLQQMGFVVTDIRRKFSVYPEDEKNFIKFQEHLPIVQHLGATIDYDWYKSSLYRIEAVHSPQPLVQGQRNLEEQVYKDHESLATPF